MESDVETCFRLLESHFVPKFKPGFVRYYLFDYKPSGLASNPGLGLLLVALRRLADRHFAVAGLADKGRALADLPRLARL